MRRLAIVVLAASCAHTDTTHVTNNPPPPASQPVAATDPPAPLPAPAAPKLVTTVEGITEYDLDNGLRVLLFPDASKPTVTINVTYFVGSRLEGYGETGMAHLLEHMMFKGTARRNDIMTELQNHGAFDNANTWYDRTTYFETLPATDENLSYALDLESDRMVNSRISAEDLAKEFSVVRSEFEMDENDQTRILEERILSTAFLWHNYGKSTIGSRSDIERVPIDNLQAFYRKYYQPDNAMLTVAGKFDPDKTLAQINQKFGTLPRPARKLKEAYTIEPVQDGEREVMLRRTGDVQVVGLAYHSVAGPDADFVPTEALIDLLTREPSGRLYKDLVQTGLATRVWGYTLPLHDPSTILLYAEVPKGKDLNAARDKMVADVEGLSDPKNKPTDAEIARFQADYQKGFELAMTDSGQTAIGLAEWAAQGDWRLLFVHRDRVEKVTAADALAAAGKYLKASNRTLGEFIPTDAPARSPLPEPVNVAALTDHYQGRAATSAGEDFDASFANIEKHTMRAALSSGAKLALLPKKTRGGSVELQMVLHFGNAKDLTGRATASQLVPDMLSRGTKTHTYEQLQDALSKLKADVSIGGGDIDAEGANAVIRVKTTHENLIPTLALVTEMLQQPSFPKDQFEIVKKNDLTQIEASRQDPTSQAFLAATRAIMPLPPTDPRYTPTTDESLQRFGAAKLDDVVAFYKDFWGASNADIAVVGDFDPKELQPVLEKSFGGWKSPKPYARMPLAYSPTKAAAQLIDTPDKEMMFVVAANSVEMRDDDPQYPALAMANRILGSGGESRLWQRLRQKEGWSYGTDSSLQVDSRDKRGMFIATAMVAPQNAQKALAAMIEESDRLAKDGVPGDELAKAQSSLKQLWDNYLANDDALVGLLASDLDLGRTMDFHEKRIAAYLAVTPADITAALKSGWLKVNVLDVTAGDLKKAGLK